MTRSIIFFVLFCMVVMVGCQRKSYVTGKVSYPDGTPLQAGEVILLSDDYAASGIIKQDGSYAIGTDSGGKGLRPGKYSVVIVNALVPGTPTPQNPDPDWVPVVHRRFAQPETSGLTIDATKSTTFDITVEKP